jgi:indolepyruvate ferredoxin oxidoreductase
MLLTEQESATPQVQPLRLDDKYTLREGVCFMSGTQALARLPLEQRWRDQAAGLNTGGYISGYRGSPLGGYDRELARIADRLQEANVRFLPGLNEDLAATAIWGTQYVPLSAEARVDGVFGIWYGKSPGVDRSGDAFQHANTAGTAPRGGVVVLAGDDHAAKSSSRTGQSDMQLRAAGIPILFPSNVQEILDHGLHGIAMSRFSGCWVSLKLVTDVVETSGMVRVGAAGDAIQMPELATAPEGGLHIRAADTPLAMEQRLYEHKLPAALAYARANGLNRIANDAPHARLGIVSAGKSWGDLQGALASLGLEDGAAVACAGIRLLKLGMVWPLDPKTVLDFMEGLDRVLVIEETRTLIEDQLRAILCDAPHGSRVKVLGKQLPPGMGPQGDRDLRFPLTGELSSQHMAAVVARATGLEVPTSPAEVTRAGPPRTPTFCSGCPHNRSTVVPEGSRAMAGIGCHAMATWIRSETTSTFTHMGAEGMFWIGQAPFTGEKHVFVNIGDGTFFHSGSLAIRQAVAAKARVTYKVLFNGYVSMTGGQPHDGELTVPRVVDIVRAEGVDRVVVVADDPGRYEGVTLPQGVALRSRTELDDVQRELRDFDGVSVLIYDQACATEQRRQRKRDPSLDIAVRTLINADVCEGCGDCGVQSNCMSIEPLDTELGRKRRINQSSCNKDLSCVEGFCPSFVTVRGGRLRRTGGRVGDANAGALPMPTLPDTHGGYNVLIAGIGGTGIVTVGAVLGTAAHLDGLAASVLDVTGLAQKYGAVMSHLRLAPKGAAIPAARLGAGEADLVIGCDLVVSAGVEALGRLAVARSWAVVNTAVNPTAEFTRSPDWDAHASDLLATLRARTGDALHAIDAGRIAPALMGDAIAINMFLLGYAWQIGRIPIGLPSIQEAIRLNGVQVSFNQACFDWGRRLAVDAEGVENAVKKAGEAQNVMTFVPRRLSRVEDIVEDRMKRLTAYQNAALAERYRALVARVQAKDAAMGGDGRLARAVARGYFRLLATKDEFEVARLYSEPAFLEQVRQQFEGDYTLHFHLGAWPFSRRHPRTGELVKRELGPWVLGAMRVLQRLRGLRGSWLDPFRHNAERRFARTLLARYEADVDAILAMTRGHALDDAVALASLPEKIRGYGRVREAQAEAVQADRLRLLEALSAAPAPALKQA